ncbi:hypothetical protein [Deinococcus soli (ex Cha et al. 2016)]|uniref:Uncharacterized protein n=2 Tax=Deinococcus soli (ex Cha et al. 2016) TaxID=1309411 RepID=A0ACC6KKX0_9DEIO|nr:hypothetical protein [Deinococcus soli (ex Cha et al. 2016)]MDR6218669.1 hypothetical protein [Deinococcus soli (ex Cha et al. 2016)]MDR6328466.1 hypothetical protein [Deinococcus soli (ex Cha et al. 2016)]MDR6753077.1 hypothetical protein [Deinococcus soli (ex Cha et al. 2016)]
MRTPQPQHVRTGQRVRVDIGGTYIQRGTAGTIVEIDWVCGAWCGRVSHSGSRYGIWVELTHLTPTSRTKLRLRGARAA